MRVSLEGLPLEIAATDKFVIVGSEEEAIIAQRLLPRQIVLWPSVPNTIGLLPLETWVRLNGSEVLLWPANTPGCKQAMEQAARSLRRVTDRLRMVYVNGEDPEGFSAAEMFEWNTPRLYEWAKTRASPWIEPPAASDPMEDLRLAQFASLERESREEEREQPVIPEADQPYRRPMKWRDLEGQEPPPREWIIDHWLTHGPTLMAGAGGIGKTHIAQTIGTAIAIGRPYLDVVARQKKVLMWACEDDHDELWRRQIAICRMFNIPLSDLEENFILEPRLGCENSLLLPEFAKPRWTELKKELHAQINDYGAEVVIIDNIGQCFGGNENDRHHVTYFMSGLVGLSDSPLSILVLGHPAKSNGSEFSGSTAWENSVRMRWYLGLQLPDQKPEDDEQETDQTVRFLCKRKTNYSVMDYRKLQYVEGAYQCEAAPTAGGMSFTERYGGAMRDAAIEKTVFNFIVDCYAKRIRLVRAGSKDAVAVMLKQAKLAQDYRPKEIENAVTRLVLAGSITDKQIGFYSNRAPKLGLGPA